MKFRVLYAIMFMGLSSFSPVGVIAFNGKIYYSAADSVAVAAVDSLKSVAVAADSVAVAAVDSLKSVAVAADSVAVAAVDSLKSMVVAADSVAVVAADSVIQAKPAIDSSLIASILNPYKYEDRSSEKLFAVKEITEEDYANCYAFYKDKLEQGLMFEAYKPWKYLFAGSEKKSISLYNDGVPIILGCLANDTIQGNFDNVSRYREEIVEIYDEAIANISDLNSQIDFTRGGDSLTVAELRSQQLYYYYNLIVMDSMAKNDHHNNYYNSDDYIYWKKIVLEDSVNVYKLYDWLRDIVYADDNSSVKHTSQYVDFSNICRAKAKYDIRKYDIANSSNPLQIEYIKLFKLDADSNIAVCERKVRDMLEQEEDLEEYTKIRNILGNLQNNFTEYASIYVVHSGGDEKVGFYEKRLEDNGGRWTDELIDAVLRNLRGTGAPIYLEAARQKYQIDPSYDLAREIALGYMKLAGNTEDKDEKKNHYTNAIVYYQNAFKFEEFYDLTNIEQARDYVTVASIYLTMSRTKNTFDYCEKARKVAPEYPNLYVVSAEAAKRIPIPAKAKNRKFLEHVKYLVAYDYLEQALQKVRALTPEQISAMKATDEASIKENMAKCAVNFPEYETVFMLSYKEGDKYSLVIPGYPKFNTTIRLSH